MKTTNKETLLNALKNALGYHDAEHEYFIYDAINVYVTTEYVFHTSELDEVEQFMIEHHMYRYFDRFVYMVYLTKTGEAKKTAIKLLSLSDKFLDISAKYFCNIHLLISFNDPKYLKYIVGDKSIKRLQSAAYAISVNKAYKFMPYIIKLSHDLPLVENMMLFKDIIIDRHEVDNYFEYGANKHQIIGSQVRGLLLHDYEKIIDGVSLSKETTILMKFLVYNKTCYEYSIKCLLMIGIDPRPYNINSSHIGYMLCPKLYDSYVWKYSLSGGIHVRNFEDALVFNVDVALHIFEKYIVDKENIKKNIWSRDIEGYFGKLRRQYLVYPSMVASIIKLLKYGIRCNESEIKHLLSLDRMTLTDYILKYHRSEMVINEVILKFQNSDCIAYGRLLARHGVYMETLCPYENIDVLGKECLNDLSMYPDIQNIIRRRRQVSINDPYKDIMIVCEMGDSAYKDTSI